MLKLAVKQEKIDKARGFAKKIANSYDWLFKDYSSTTIERTILRLMGIDGVIGETPIPNIIVEHLQEKKAINRGVAYWIANAIVAENMTAQEVANGVAKGELDLTEIEIQDDEKIFKCLDEYSNKMLNHIKKQREYRKNQYKKHGPRRKPSLYLIVATGNIYEDVAQAKAAAREGADIIAIIRSTAQSLLDYVPYGATTVGFGGTFATQENFKIVREGLDEVGEEIGKYISLTNYASGLCMPEISAMGAIERLDIMLNDAMYGILFRDINPKRTLLDQYFSRMINAYAGIEIQTGEDNYLTTSDAIEKAYTVTASQLINEQFAYISGITPAQLGIGHAYEIDPDKTNGFLYELSHAMLTKKLFPNSPAKYMPPTKFATGNIFKTYAMNAMFNLVSQMTGQGVQLLGMMTEAIHTPHLVDRALAIENAEYIFNTTKDLAKELVLKEDSFIDQRAEKVLSQASNFLERVSEEGLLNALENGEFADIKRSQDGGKGLNGVFKIDENYSNPFMDKMKAELNLV